MIQALISHGHRLTDIPNYTLKQCEHFLAAIADSDRAANRMQVLAVRAVWADEAAFQELWDSV